MKHKWLLWAAAVAVVLALAVMLVWWPWFNLGKWDERGQFGSMFGAVAALFSALAFAGAILTFWRIRAQTDILGKQRFEMAYLQLMDSIWDTSDVVFLDCDGKRLEGYEVIERVATKTARLMAAQEVLDSSDGSAQPASRNSFDECGDLLKQAGLDVDATSNGLRPLLHALKVCLDFLHTSSLTHAEKRRYSDWVRGYFVQPELLVIGLLSMRDEKLKRLVERYGILRYVGESGLTDRFLRRRFDPSAFSE
jgi:hypothetical protein